MRPIIVDASIMCTTNAKMISIFLTPQAKDPPGEAKVSSLSNYWLSGAIDCSSIVDLSDH
jgi:hypothetical protein